MAAKISRSPARFEPMLDGPGTFVSAIDEVIDDQQGSFGLLSGPSRLPWPMRREPCCWSTEYSGRCSDVAKSAAGSIPERGIPATPDRSAGTAPQAPRMGHSVSLVMK